MKEYANTLPQVRIAEGNEFTVTLSLGSEQVLLSADEAVALAATLINLQWAHSAYSLAVNRLASACGTDG